MENASRWIASLFVPGMILMIAAAFIIVVRVMASRYKKIPPNTVGIFLAGVKGPDNQIRGFRIVAGG